MFHHVLFPKQTRWSWCSSFHGVGRTRGLPNSPPPRFPCGRAARASPDRGTTGTTGTTDVQDAKNVGRTDAPCARPITIALERPCWSLVASMQDLVRVSYLSKGGVGRALHTEAQPSLTQACNFAVAILCLCIRQGQT